MTPSGYPIADATRPGLMSAAQAEKLAGIPEGGGGGPIDSVTDGNGLELAGGVLSMGAATTSVPGALSAADKVKLDAQSGTNTGDVTVSSPAGWLSLAGQALTFALVSAGAAVAGVVDTAAQTFAGVKTFTSAIIASAGIQLASLWNTNGTGASDVGLKLGVSTADGSVNASAKIVSWRTGIGTGTEVEYGYTTKSGTTFSGLLSATNLRATNQLESQGSNFFALAFYRRGSNTTAAPGNATVNLTTGKSAIASGATTCTITSSYCVAAARVMITWHGDHGAARSWVVVNAGNFVVTLSDPASGATSFSWEIDYLY